MAFNAPRVVGQGQIQKGHVVDPIGDLAKTYSDSKKWKTEMDESQKRYDQDYYMKAVDQNLREKWMHHQEVDQARQIWDGIPQGDRPNYTDETAKAFSRPKGSKMSYDHWFQETYGKSTIYAANQMANANQAVNQAKNNSIVTSLQNPFTGRNETKVNTKQGTVWHPSSGNFGVFSDVAKKGQDMWGNLMGQQKGGLIGMMRGGYERGKYLPGDRTGDKNPAMLEDGEYVLNRNAVDKMGKGFLDYINNEKYPRFPGEKIGMQAGGFRPLEPMGGQAQIQRQGPTENVFSGIADVMMEAGKKKKKENNQQDDDPFINQSSEYDPMYEDMNYDAFDPDFGTAFAQSGGFNPDALHKGGRAQIQKQKEVDDVFSGIADTIMASQGGKQRGGQINRFGY